ncbi:nucleotide sugar dehydrogenase [Alphaproteobacteria bacterium]|nr:nucleotide sugar dehydrogenase [Alphaproteobacteria bacterium]
MIKELNQKIKSKELVVGIIGLGYVGLPLMSSICSTGLRVIGFDIDRQKIENLNQGRSYLETLSSEDLIGHIDDGHFIATDDFSLLKDTDVIIICVPTPLNIHKDPDLSFVQNTTKTISKFLRKGQMVVLESTTYPGCSTDLVKPILEANGLNSEVDFLLAYSPEREDPGNKNFSTTTTPKIVGGIGPIATALASEFYSLFIEEVVEVSSAETAEAVKITENVFRAVNIALVNELKLIYEKMGVDVWEVIEAAKTKPFGFMPFYPGPGLGGHCIPIDPFYLSWKAKEFGINTRFIELAGEINHSMPEYVVNKAIAELSMRQEKSIKGANILIMGVAYKKNINDQRETPAFPIMSKLISLGAEVEYFDPHIDEILPSRNFKNLNGMKSVVWNCENLIKYDATIIVTDHDNVDYESLAKNSNLIIDTRNVLKLFGNLPNVVKS